MHRRRALDTACLLIYQLVEAAAEARAQNGARSDAYLAGLFHLGVTVMHEHMHVMRTQMVGLPRTSRYRETSSPEASDLEPLGNAGAVGVDGAVS